MTLSLWWLAIPISLMVFLMLRFINNKISQPIFKALTNPVCYSIIIIATMIYMLNLPYNQYAEHTQILSWLLQPAIVALALPLYQQLSHIKSNAVIIITSCTLGVCNATVVAVVICNLYSAPFEISASLASLSVTTPITLLVTESLGGIPSLAAAMVIFIGVLGAVFGNLIMQLINVSLSDAKGMAIGTACHAIGTASLITEQPKAGAFASVAMVLSALLSAIIVPWLFPLLAKLLL